MASLKDMTGMDNYMCSVALVHCPMGSDPIEQTRADLISSTYNSCEFGVT